VLTPAPTEVQEIHDVGLPEPRDQVTTKGRPEFAELRARIYRSIKRRVV
jgi:NitT/TauT family transport system ATP-binding protein